MAFDEQRVVGAERAEPVGSQPGLSETRSVVPLPNEALIVQLRAGIQCAEKCQLLLTIDEVARVLYIGTTEVERLITTKQLASIIFAEQELIPVREVVDFIADYSNISRRSTI